MRDLNEPKKKMSGLDSVLTAMRERHGEDQNEKKILLVEDSRSSQLMMIRMLQTLNVTIDKCENGKQALEKLTKNKYDLVFMDCQMPVMDGFETTTRLRLIESDLERHTPVVAISANTREESREKCLCAGMDDYLSKPITRQQFLEAVKRWVD